MRTSGRVFFATVCTPEWNIEQDRGRSWDEAEALLLAEHPQQEHLIRGFRRNWHDMVSHAYDDSVAILESLMAQGHDVTLLTNFAADTFAEARERFTFLQKASRRHGFGRGEADQAAARDLRPARAHIRAGAGRDAVHRRQRQECSRRNRCGLAGDCISRARRSCAPIWQLWE